MSIWPISMNGHLARLLTDLLTHLDNLLRKLVCIYIVGILNVERQKSAYANRGFLEYFSGNL